MIKKYSVCSQTVFKLFRSNKSSEVKISYKTLSESDKTKILTIVQNSMKQEFNNCDQNRENWYDTYGQCYRMIGELIINGLGSYTSEYWTNSHWNYCTGHRSDFSVLFQFNYGDLHFTFSKCKFTTF
jgi:hypothetical protein